MKSCPLDFRKKAQRGVIRLNITLLNCSITGQRGLDKQRHQLLVDKRGMLGSDVEL